MREYTFFMSLLQALEDADGLGIQAGLALIDQAAQVLFDLRKPIALPLRSV
jgi:hypothetical protein